MEVRPTSPCSSESECIFSYCDECKTVLCDDCFIVCDLCLDVGFCDSCADNWNTCKLCGTSTILCDECNHDPSGKRPCELCFTNMCDGCAGYCVKSEGGKCPVSFCKDCSCCCETCNAKTNAQAAAIRLKITDFNAASSELSDRLSSTLDMPLEQRLAMPLQDAAQDWITDSFESTKDAFQNFSRAVLRKPQ